MKHVCYMYFVISTFCAIELATNNLPPIGIHYSGVWCTSKKMIKNLKNLDLSLVKLMKLMGPARGIFLSNSSGAEHTYNVLDHCLILVLAHSHNFLLGIIKL